MEKNLEFWLDLYSQVHKEAITEYAHRILTGKIVEWK